MTEEEIKMIVMLIRQQDAEAQPADLGGHMIAPPPMQPPMEGGSISPQPQQGGDNNMGQIARMLAERSGPVAGSAGGPLSAAESAAFTPIYAPESLAVGGANAPVLQVGEVLPGNIGASYSAGSGGAASGGGAAGLAAPAAAMAGLIYGGKKLGIGAESQLQEYKRFGKRAGKEFGRAADKLKFWEWF